MCADKLPGCTGVATITNVMVSRSGDTTPITSKNSNTLRKGYKYIPGRIPSTQACPLVVNRDGSIGYRKRMDPPASPPIRGHLIKRPSTGNLVPGDSPPSVVRNIVSQDRHEKDRKMKIFLLLLSPKAKIFELIQLTFSSSTTKVGDLLAMIPTHATQGSCSSQNYTGIIRPQKQATAATSLKAFVAHPHNPNSLGIVQGEILVAIPEGYETRRIVSLSKHILTKDRLQELVHRITSEQKVRSGSEGLGASKANEKGKKRSTKELTAEASPSSIQKEAVPELCKLESLTPDTPSTSAIPIRSANVASMRTSDEKSVTSLIEHSNISSRSEPLRRTVRGNYAEDVSLQGSYSAWTQSLENSIAHRQQKMENNIWLVKATTAFPNIQGGNQNWSRETCLGALSVTILILAIIWYFVDKSSPFDEKRTTEGQHQAPMGVSGSTWALLTFMILWKLQSLLSLRRNTLTSSKCPFLQHGYQYKEQMSEESKK